MSLSSLNKRGVLRFHPSLRGKQLENLTRQPGNSRAHRVPLHFGKRREYRCFPKKHVCNYIHPKQYGPFPDRLKLPYPDEEILSRFEEDVSSIRDGFTAWVKTEFATILERHTVDNRKVHAVFREAFARKHVTSC